MGSPAAEPGHHADEAPQTKVTLSKGFWLGTTPVTIGQWQAVMGQDVRGQLMRVIDDNTLYNLDGKWQTKRDYMHFSRERAAEYLAGESADLPMYFVTWDDAMEFSRRVTALERAKGRLPSGLEYDLPSEAQWEYAARAGTRTVTHVELLDAIAWYSITAPTATGARASRSLPARSVAHVPLLASGLTTGACMTWPAMYGSGAETGTGLTRAARLSILRTTGCPTTPIL